MNIFLASSNVVEKQTVDVLNDLLLGLIAKSLVGLVSMREPEEHVSHCDDILLMVGHVGVLMIASLSDSSVFFKLATTLS